MGRDKYLQYLVDYHRGRTAKRNGKYTFKFQIIMGCISEENRKVYSKGTTVIDHINDLKYRSMVDSDFVAYIQSLYMNKKKSEICGSQVYTIFTNSLYVLKYSYVGEVIIFEEDKYINFQGLKPYDNLLGYYEGYHKQLLRELPL